MSSQIIPQHFDVVIIGAGAAGLMCAIEAAKRGKRVVILEKATKPGRKILISGGGRCNFTNMDIDPDAYISNNLHFCKSALSRYTQWDFMQLMEKHALSWNEKTLGQLFCDQKAPAIVQMLLDECEHVNVRIVVDCNVATIAKKHVYKIQSNQGDFSAISLIVATGGPSIPKMGATDFCMQIARQFKIKSIPFYPALVPLLFTAEDHKRIFSGLSGISLTCMVRCENQEFKEKLLITHKGLSGPAILQISSYWRPGRKIFINLLPDENALEFLQKQKNNQPSIQLSTALACIIPKRLAAKLCDLYFDNKPLKQYSEHEFKAIAIQLSEWVLEPTGTQGMRTAEVSLGGIDCNQISSKTFESKKSPGLYFIGEAVDVTGHLGGYNFQWAWASGWCSGQFV